MERNTKEDLQSTPAVHTMYRSLSGTDKLAAEQYTVPVLLHVLHVRFHGSFSTSWRCEGSQQTGETAQVPVSKASILPTHWTEYLDFLMPLNETTMMALHSEA